MQYLEKIYQFVLRNTLNMVEKMINVRCENRI